MIDIHKFTTNHYYLPRKSMSNVSIILQQKALTRVRHVICVPWLCQQNVCILTHTSTQLGQWYAKKRPGYCYT